MFSDSHEVKIRTLIRSIIKSNSIDIKILNLPEEAYGDIVFLKESSISQVTAHLYSVLVEELKKLKNDKQQ